MLTANDFAIRANQSGVATLSYQALTDGQDAKQDKTR